MPQGSTCFETIHELEPSFLMMPSTAQENRRGSLLLAQDHQVCVPFGYFFKEMVKRIVGYIYKAAKATRVGGCVYNGRQVKLTSLIKHNVFGRITRGKKLSSKRKAFLYLLLLNKQQTINGLSLSVLVCLHGLSAHANHSHTLDYDFYLIRMFDVWAGRRYLLVPVRLNKTVQRGVGQKVLYIG